MPGPPPGQGRAPSGPNATGSDIAIFLIVLATTLGFAAYTRHAWEDFYITYRASENLATGHGFVFTTGERLHTYTSPLGALIPAGLRFILGPVSPEVVLWAFRVISAFVLALAVVGVVRIGRQLGWAPPACLLAAGLLAFDLKSVDFSINGMETALLLSGLVASAWSLIARPAPSWKWIGAIWALLLWIRPDSFVYFGALAAGWLWFSPRSGDTLSRAQRLTLLFKAGLVCTALYLPWLLTSTAYYGTPVPHTVTAKGLTVDRELGDIATQALLFPLKLFTPGSPFRLLFTPAYVDTGGWPIPVRLFSYGLGALSALIWLWPGASALTRTFSFATMGGGFYLDAICPYPAPWYVPATALLAAFTLGGASQDVITRIRSISGGPPPWLARTVSWLPVGAATAVLVQIVVLGSGAVQLRHQQQLIETGHRREIGLWLKANARSPGDSVFLECLGYIGYFSDLKMLDHPGLSSLEMVNARRELGTDDWNRLVPRLRPDWLVLRPHEVTRLGGDNGALLTQSYTLARRFDVSEAVAHVPWLPGRPYLESDQTFLVYRRAATP